MAKSSITVLERALAAESKVKALCKENENLRQRIASLEKTIKLVEAERDKIHKAFMDAGAEPEH